MELPFVLSTSVLDLLLEAVSTVKNLNPFGVKLPSSKQNMFVNDMNYTYMYVHKYITYIYTFYFILYSHIDGHHICIVYICFGSKKDQ